MFLKAEEHFCDVEQDSYPAGDFGRDPDGLLVHIKEKPAGDVPGKGHTLRGWKVNFSGSPSEVDATKDEWTLTKVWARQ